MSSVAKRYHDRTLVGETRKTKICGSGQAKAHGERRILAERRGKPRRRVMVIAEIFHRLRRPCRSPYRAFIMISSSAALGHRELACIHLVSNTIFCRVGLLSLLFALLLLNASLQPLGVGGKSLGKQTVNPLAICLP